jgi:nitronate monooxygenase
MAALHTPVCGLLGCETPIVLAGMGGVARSELVAAVSEAGGFGFLGMVRERPEFITAQTRDVRRRTSRPFGVNLIPAATKPELLEGELAACIEAKVRAVTLFWDLAPAVIQRLREAGILVVCQVGSGTEALAAERAGADIVIAQGVEAGGHVRGITPLRALLAEVVSKVKLPVLAAGGLVDGADLAWALGAGAQGIVLGTALLATQESFAHDYHKQRIVQASHGEPLLTEIFHINWPPNAAVRVLPNSVTRGEHGDPYAPERQVIGADGARNIFLFSTDSPLRSMTGNLEAMAIYAGQGAGRIDAIPTAGERIGDIVAEAAALLEGQEVAPEAASPVCYARDAGDAYMGYADREELVAELTALLEAERAGARVGASLVSQAPDSEFKALAGVIQADEVKWARALFDALVALNAEPSDKVGDFYEKALAISGFEDRLAFTNRGQGWVVRKLQALLPRVRDDGLHAVLAAMLQAHETNIASANQALERRGHAVPGVKT